MSLTMLYRYDAKLVEYPFKGQKSRWWWNDPSLLFPVPSYLENHCLTSHTSFMCTRMYSDTYCTHTRAHSLHKTTGRVKGKPRQSLSSDISSATLLTVCLTSLPFWEKLGSYGKHFMMSPFKQGLFVSVDVQGCSFTSFRKISLHHRPRLFCNIWLLRSPLISGRTLVKMELLGSSRMRYNYERPLARGIFLLLWSTALCAQ